MNIKPINVYHSYAVNTPQIRRRENPAVSFGVKNRIADELAANNRNPIIKYANDIFKRSLAASARRIVPVIPELQPLTKEVAINSSEKEKTYAWDIKNKKQDKYVLYLHGASQNITNVQNLYKSIVDNTDFSILALEYRGFGKNKSKKVNSQTFLEDTTAAVDYLEKDKRIEGKNIFVVGHSMGTYPASQLASNRQELGRLVLVSPLGSLANQPLDVNLWFANRMPKMVRFLFKNFKVLRKPLQNFFKIEGHIQKTKIPVDIIHAQNDRLIKYTASKGLADLCPNLHSLNILKQGGHKMEKNKIDSIIAILRDI